MLLQYILDEYASKAPCSMKPENEMLPEGPGLRGASSAPQSDFGKLIIREVVGGDAAVPPADTALLVYAGNIYLLSFSAELSFVFSLVWFHLVPQ